MQLILQKLANNSNSFHRFETNGKEHSQITVIALNKISINRAVAIVVIQDWVPKFDFNLHNFSTK